MFGLEEGGLYGDLTVAFQYIKGAYEKMQRNLLLGPVMTGQGAMVLN